MPADAVAICNKALIQVGSTRLITALDGSDDSLEASLCALLYEDARDELLSEFDWPFARRHAVLVEDESVEHLLWNYAYALPADCLRPQWISTTVRRNLPEEEIPFALEANAAGTGQLLWCDIEAVEDESPYLRYTAEITDVGAFPLLFADALSRRLAVDLTMGLPVKPELRRTLHEAYEISLSRAQAFAHASERLDPQPDSEFIAARR